jgi:uracil-DNA glycosylase family 4
MKGFFSNKDYSHKFVHPTAPRAAGDKAAVDDCEKCGLYKDCLSPKMPPSGFGRLGILIIAEAPGGTEDAKGIPLVGEAGQLLGRFLRELGHDLERDFWKTNAIICRPPSNRTPTSKEIMYCRKHWQKVVDDLRPRFIWLMGGTALDTFYTDKDIEKSQASITSWRGWCIPDYQTGAWVIPMYHPSFVLRQNDPTLDAVFKADLKWAISCLHRKPPEYVDPRDKVHLLTNKKDVMSLLSRIRTEKPHMVFDYETTGLKPYAAGHKVLTAAVSIDRENAYAFPLQYSYWSEPDSVDILERWTEILHDQRIPKIAHNLKFEHKWGRVVLKTETRGWDRCTMNIAHLLDTRQGISGLKTQAFLRWGIEAYDHEVKKLFAPDENGINKLEMCPLETLLLYNGTDAILEYWLWEEQEKKVRRNTALQSIYNTIVHPGLLALEDCEDAGFRADPVYFAKTNEDLTIQITNSERELRDSDEAIKFEHMVGRPLKLKSSKDLGELFFSVLGLSPTKQTATGRPSVDVEALGKLQLPFAQKLVGMRKLLKIRDTYLSQFAEAMDADGIIHPSFDLHTAASGRSSCNDPNMQNIPVRDDDAKRIIRSGIIPSPGYELMEVDYKAIEVRIMACYSHDPVLIRYVNDPDTDMHRDQAEKIFVLSRDEVTKFVRKVAKNGFVFPQFYGDWYKACAKNIWEQIDGKELTEGVLVTKHLASVGINSYAAFESHMKTVEDQFWGLLAATKQWRDEVTEFFREHLYVENYLGFRRNGYLSRNQIVNTPIQGTAFQCLQWSLNKLNHLRREQHWRTKIIGQIHDSIVFDLWPGERDYLVDVIEQVMCEDIREQFEWIIVPLEVDFAFGGVDRSWFYCGEE